MIINRYYQCGEQGVYGFRSKQKAPFRCELKRDLFINFVDRLVRPYQSEHSAKKMRLRIFCNEFRVDVDVAHDVSHLRIESSDAVISLSAPLKKYSTVWDDTP